MSNNAKVAAFIAAHQLSFHVERVDSRLNDSFEIDENDPMVNAVWARVENASRRHWYFQIRTLRHDGGVSGFFTQGSAHTETPTISDILESLAVDARSATDCADVLEFGQNFGHDLNSVDGANRCRETFAACVHTVTDLIATLGKEGFEELLALDFDEC